MFVEDRQSQESIGSNVGASVDYFSDLLLDGNERFRRRGSRSSSRGFDARSTSKSTQQVSIAIYQKLTSVSNTKPTFSLGSIQDLLSADDPVGCDAAVSLWHLRLSDIRKRCRISDHR